jgi:hypothetical protein
MEEINNVDFREFWWGSELLTRASFVQDARVVTALVQRHQCLSNKKAFSAHVLRETIKKIDGSNFRLLWNIIDSETDAQVVNEGLNNPFYLPWAAVWVLGEIGGINALTQATARLGPEHAVRLHLIISLISHATTRYHRIQEEGLVTQTFIDLKTGAISSGNPTAADSETYKMEMLRRRQANEYFTPLESETIADLTNGLAAILNYPTAISAQMLMASVQKLPIRRRDF